MAEKKSNKWVVRISHVWTGEYHVEADTKAEAEEKAYALYGNDEKPVEEWSDNGDVVEDETRRV